MITYDDDNRLNTDKNKMNVVNVLEKATKVSTILQK